MQIAENFAAILAWASAHPLLSGILAVFVILFTFSVLKDLLKIIIFLVILGFALYFAGKFVNTAAIGVDSKDALIHKSRAAGGE